nr:hypothetical protein [Rouxiella badensis]
MHKVHESACAITSPNYPKRPVLARPEALHATALKAAYKAGRRGGGSIARKGCRRLALAQPAACGV